MVGLEGLSALEGESAFNSSGQARREPDELMSLLVIFYTTICRHQSRAAKESRSSETVQDLAARGHGTSESGPDAGFIAASPAVICCSTERANMAESMYAH